jgi:hypothetical protein
MFVVHRGVRESDVKLWIAARLHVVHVVHIKQGGHMGRNVYSASELEPLLPVLRAAGYPVERNAGQSVREALSIEQSGLCYIAVNEGPGTRYMVDLSITCTRGEVSLCAFDLALPWEDPSFTWLPDPREISAPHEAYRFPGTALIYPRADVINHCCRNVLRRGRYIGGLLLGFGMKAIPNEFKHGSELDMSLSIISGVGTFSASVKFEVDRAADRLRKGSARPQQSKGLFERAKPDGLCQQQGADYRRGDPVGVHVSREGRDIAT